MFYLKKTKHCKLSRQALLIDMLVFHQKYIQLYNVYK